MTSLAKNAGVQLLLCCGEKVHPVLISPNVSVEVLAAVYDSFHSQLGFIIVCVDKLSDQ